MRLTKGLIPAGEILTWGSGFLGRMGTGWFICRTGAGVTWGCRETVTPGGKKATCGCGGCKAILGTVPWVRFVATIWVGGGSAGASLRRSVMTCRIRITIKLSELNLYRVIAIPIIFTFWSLVNGMFEMWSHQTAIRIISNNYQNL